MMLEQLRKLTKEELLALIEYGQGFSFYMPTQEQINRAKAKVLRRKADDYFSRWLEVDTLSRSTPGTTTSDQIKRLEQRQLSEKLYRKYQRCWERADKLEFGDQDAIKN